MEPVNETPIEPREFCNCPDWETCGCGNQPPYHCMWCCKDLTPEQLARWNFEDWDYIPPRPKSLPVQISCGRCGVTIDNPTEEQVNFHFSEEHNAITGAAYIVHGRTDDSGKPQD